MQSIAQGNSDTLRMESGFWVTVVQWDQFLRNRKHPRGFGLDVSMWRKTGYRKITYSLGITASYVAGVSVGSK